MSSSKKVATVVLAVYNGAGTVGPALDSLLTQSIPVEIIVIDDGSTDGTSSILRKYRGRVRIVREKHAGPAIARNLGVTFATTGIVLFADADMAFNKDYVKDLVAPILKGTAIGTYTVEERVANWENIWAKCWNWQEGWEDGKRFRVNPPKWGTDYRAILKSEFERVGGFDNIGYTDTWSLFGKLGTRPLATNAMCYHKNPDSLAAVYRQAKWSAERPYKLGNVGTVIALARTTLPVSLVTGLYKSALHGDFRFLVFKTVYDWGRFVGILELLFIGSKMK